MDEFFSRCATSFIGGFLFFGAYFYSTFLFSVVLAVILIYILIFEWPRLIDPKTIAFWLVTPLYPVLPVFSLIYLNQFLRSFNILIPLYPFFIAWSADIVSYCFGSLFGKHKICPRISPGKSYEGLSAAYVVITFIMFFLFPGLKLVNILLLSFIFSISGFLGDIFISFLKRRAGLKDTGKILPGHGGMLDRFDSVFFVSVVVLISMLMIKCV